MGLQVLPIHKHPKYLMECCELINDEWTRSQTARLRSLEASSDKLPTCLVLIDDDKVIGHCRLSPIPSIKDSCFVESVVISRKLRGKGYGRHLMSKAEEYCKVFLKLNVIYLSTLGQEGFYAKLGYKECLPVSIYGNFVPTNTSLSRSNSISSVSLDVPGPPPPPPPPQPTFKIEQNKKIFMNKYLYS